MSKNFKIILISLITFGALIYVGVFIQKRLASNIHPEAPNPGDVIQEKELPAENVSNQTEPSAIDTSDPLQEIPALDQNSDTQEPLQPNTDNPSKTSPFIPQTISSTDSNAHVYIPLSKISCGKNCDQFTKEAEKKYCQEYCGFEAVSENEDCSILSSLEQDYCLKDKAIRNTDASHCKKITDDNIRVACQNRVLEDIVDKQQSER